MLGLRCEEWKRSQHMLTAPPSGYPIVTAAADCSSFSSSSPSVNSFSKDGRKISVGDCALFKPPNDCPPFIGIIRLLSLGKDNKLNLGVNWLYRPAEVKLGKGVLLEATPNEIFYSFHKDEIPAASLLHPCKVAFLPKGVELPSGTSSFVCRRVYDTTNKRLWWLTDQDYINEHQEEVNNLLHKTQVEMHAAQTGGRSPKPMNSTSSASPLKAGSDTVQNSTTYIPSHVKGKKRERVDLGPEHGKRERTTKLDDGDSGPCRQGSMLKIEMAKITEKGGLIDSEGVEKLVRLMSPDKKEKKIDLAGRSILAGAIAATDKSDCLSQFVQLRGLLVFDEWLQEVHKGKIGDHSGPKDSDKSVEEFLLVLLRALDKLPVNLQALQMCNIGKSVNHLRSHKNLEIQKKARGLVDTWKKGVEAEMNINDAKSGLNQAVAWPVRPRLLEVSQGGIRDSGGFSEVAVKSSVSQVSASKTSSCKTAQGEITSRSASAPASSASPPSSLKLLPPPAAADANMKEWQPHSANLVGVPDLPFAVVRDEKLSGSSQPHNSSQSSSGEQTKSGGMSGKKDVRGSGSASLTANKTSAGSSRHRKSNNGLPVSNPSGMHREAGTARSSSVNKNTPSDKLSQPGVVFEKTTEGTSVEGNSNKLIVKISNQCRNHAQDTSSGFPDDPLHSKNRASSPVLSEMPNLSEHSLKETTDLRSVLTGMDEVDGSPAVVSDDSEKEVSKTAVSSFVNENNGSNLQDTSFSSMNALVESCVKHSEGNANVSAVDDTGMNLLASVAAGEISKSYSATSTRSPQRNSTLAEEPAVDNNAESEKANEGNQDDKHPSDSDENKQINSDFVGCDSLASNADRNSAALVSQEKSAGEKNKHGCSPSQELHQTKEKCLDGVEILGEKQPDASLPVLPGGALDEVTSKGGEEQLFATNIAGKIEGGDNDAKPILGCPNIEVENDLIEKSKLNANMEVDDKGSECLIERLNVGSQTELKPPAMSQFQSVQGDEQVSCNSCPAMGKVKDDFELKAEKSEQFDTGTHGDKDQIQKPNQEENIVVSKNRRVLRTQASKISGQDVEHIGDNLANKEADDQQNGQMLQDDSPANQSKESEQEVGSKESRLTAMQAEEAEECSSTAADASSRSATGMSDGDGKVEFDLNEGLNADDGKCLDVNSTSSLGFSNPVRLISPVPVSATGASNSGSRSITVAAAAKGRFLPPEDLLRNKVQVGWKGSAATSAFRPAEPRRVPEMSLHTSSMPLSDATAIKQSRPILDIDLNVPDERMLEDTCPQSFTVKDECPPIPKDVPETSEPRCSSGRINLDLNQADESPEVGPCLTSSSQRMDVPVMQSKLSSGVPGSCGMGVHRDFDLNNGPTMDEVNVDPLVYNQQAKINVPSQPPIPGFWMSNSEIGNLSPWFPSAGNNYSAVTLSSIVPERGDQQFPVVAACAPQRVPVPSSAAGPLGVEAYRGPILSSSPAVPYPSGAFQYPVFHVGPNFPLPSTSLAGASVNYVDPSSVGRLSFPTANPQLFGTAASVPSHYPRPYIGCIPEGCSSSGSESSRKWARQGLDLNAGPGGSDVEGKDDSVPLALRQLTVGSPQALAEERARIFQMTGSALKRKEPEGGWDGFKQTSWQ